MSRRQFQALWAMLIIVSIFGALTIAGLFAWRSQTIRLDRETTRRQHDFCDLVKVFVDPSQPPPTTDRGRVQLQKLREYAARDC